MIDRENYPEGENQISGQSDQELNGNNPQTIEEQEQINSENLVQRVEEDREADSNYGDVNEITDETSQGEEDLSGFLERTLPGSESTEPIGSDQPVTKNLLGDNPPGSEQAAFDAGNTGDMNADIAKYDTDAVANNLRESADKAQQQIDLDNRLRNEAAES